MIYILSYKYAYTYLAVIAFVFINSETKLYAQSPPAVNPANWILISSKSDEFNDSALDNSKWWTIDPCFFTDSIHHGFNGAEGAFFRSENVSLGNGNLVLKVDYNPDSLNYSFPCLHYHNYPFYSGGIVSPTINGGPGLGSIGNYSYGYYEMSAKLPGYYDSTGKSVGYGFYPTFWIAYQYAKNGCVLKQDEVDILEPDPLQFYDARTNVVGVFDETDSCTAYKAIQDSVRGVTPLFDGYHKFAVELLPDKITFYLDDVAFYSADTLTSPGLSHIINMVPYLSVNIELFMGGFYSGSHPYPDAPFPEYMYVDYFRYYQLSPDYNPGNSLFQNSPNPFKSTTEIFYSVDNSSTNSFINIYNMLGMEVKSFRLQAKGNSEIMIDGTDLSSGMYLYSLIVDKKIISTKRLMVLK